MPHSARRATQLRPWKPVLPIGASEPSGPKSSTTRSPPVWAGSLFTRLIHSSSACSANGKTRVARCFRTRGSLIHVVMHGTSAISGERNHKRTEEKKIVIGRAFLWAAGCRSPEDARGGQQVRGRARH